MLLSPGGRHHLEDLDRAGGVPAVMKTLLEGGLVDPAAPVTVTGQTVADNLADVKVLDPEVIRPLSNPYHAQGGIAILKGNLAPDGGVVKQSAVDEKMLVNEGTARVFEAEEEATRAILDGQHQARGHRGHPLRGSQGRPRYAGDAHPHLRHRRSGPG